MFSYDDVFPEMKITKGTPFKSCMEKELEEHMKDCDDKNHRRDHHHCRQYCPCCCCHCCCCCKGKKV